MGRKAKSKVGKLDPTKREDIILVFKYFQHHRAKGQRQESENNMYKKVATALSVSPRTVQNVVNGTNQGTV